MTAQMTMNIESMCIRQIRTDELRHCFSFWDFENDAGKRQRIESEMENHVRRVYACILDGQYLAGMSLTPLDRETVYLSYLVVREDWRNQGIGARMIAYAKQVGRQEGYSCIVLTVDHKNTEAERLYRRLGFVASGNNGNRTEMRAAL